MLSLKIFFSILFLIEFINGFRHCFDHFFFVVNAFIMLFSASCVVYIKWNILNCTFQAKHMKYRPMDDGTSLV